MGRSTHMRRLRLLLALTCEVIPAKVSTGRCGTSTALMLLLLLLVVTVMVLVMLNHLIARQRRPMGLMMRWTTAWMMIIPGIAHTVSTMLLQLVVSRALLLGVGESTVWPPGTRTAIVQIPTETDLVVAIVRQVARLLQLPIAVVLHKVYQTRNDPFDRLQGRRTLNPARDVILRVPVDASQVLQIHAQPGQVGRIARALQGDDQLLYRLHERLRCLQLVVDALHVRLVRRVAVQQRRPLIGRDPQPRLGRDLHDLRVVASYVRNSSFSCISEESPSRFDTLKQLARYSSCTTCPIDVLDACEKCGSSRWTTNITSTLRDSADPSSSASSTSFSTSSCIAGPRNWQPRARTAAHRFVLSCCGFWWCRISSMTVRSPSERAARNDLARPSSSISWQLTSITSFRCICRDSKLPPPPPVPLHPADDPTPPPLLPPDPLPPTGHGLRSSGPRLCTLVEQRSGSTTLPLAAVAVAFRPPPPEGDAVLLFVPLEPLLVLLLLLLLLLLLDELELLPLLPETLLRSSTDSMCRII
uniref:Uncharacterized protein n=1 Tax=Anopheles atroparvus TaxID=41427 RepID=A0A182JIU8_ANOAO